MRIYELRLCFRSLCRIRICSKGGGKKIKLKKDRTRERWCLHSCCLNQTSFLAALFPPCSRDSGKVQPWAGCSGTGHLCHPAPRTACDIPQSHILNHLHSPTPLPRAGGGWGCKCFLITCEHLLGMRGRLSPQFAEGQNLPSFRSRVNTGLASTLPRGRDALSLGTPPLPPLHLPVKASPAGWEMREDKSHSRLPHCSV